MKNSNLLTVTAIEFTDVRGKKQLYLKLQNTRQEELVINVGEKTYNEVKNMTTDTTVTNIQFDTPVEETNNNNKNEKGKK